METISIKEIWREPTNEELNNAFIKLAKYNKEKFIEDLNLKDLIQEKIKEMLTTDSFIQILAQEKIRRSLGL